MRHLRCMVARWLRRQADRLDPPQQVTVRLTANTVEFDRAMTQAKETLRKYGYATHPWPYAHVRQGEQPDPLAPPPKYAGYVGPNVTPSESGVAVTFTDSLPRRDT